MIKTVSEADLNSDFSLRENSKAAYLTFFAGLIGAILCVVVFFMTEGFFRDLKVLVDRANENQYRFTLEEQVKIREQIDERTQTFFDRAVPIFLSANVLWIIGGFSWTVDLKRKPANRLLWKLGGLLVLVTALACSVAWISMILLYFRGQ